MAFSPCPLYIYEADVRAIAWSCRNVATLIAPENPECQERGPSRLFLEQVSFE